MNYMKAVEYEKLPKAFRKRNSLASMLASGEYVVEPKFDGQYGVIIVGGFRATLLTRTGHPVLSCDHLLEAFGQYDKPGAFIGELWEPGTDCATISGKCRTLDAQYPELMFMAHDYVEWDPVTRTLHSDLSYMARRARLQTALPQTCHQVFTTRMHEWVTMEELGSLMDYYAAPSYDGVMIKRKSAGYTPGLVKGGELVKWKHTLSLDLRVVGTQVTTSAVLGRQVLTLAVDYNGERTWVGSGVPHHLSPEDVLGKIVEVECLGVTRTGKLREPRFKTIRNDKTEVDQ